MNGRVRLTPLGGTLLVLLGVALLALFVGSSAVQGVGFVIALIVVIVMIGDRLPRMRVGGGHDLGFDSPSLRRNREGAERESPDDRQA
jgi:hypothetical protein